MSRAAPFSPPTIVDADEDWACELLGLPPKAFGGADGSNSRLEVLKSLATVDVEACPGSGKTTLLVAKLAILARDWKDARRGICVLSHTNVARREIEARLGDTAEGRRLLSYPHFIGTIHGFMNEFLAAPWMRSLGLPIRTIDDDVTLRRRWWKLPRNIREVLEQSGHDLDIMRVTSVDYAPGTITWGRSRKPLKEDSEIVKAIHRACKASCEEGYFCYSEMFLWAEHLLTAVGGVRESIRDRFPMYFLDEVQDNSEEQSALLFKVFTEGEGAVIRQRFGDSNQAIFHSSSQTEGARTDPFSDPAIRRHILHSCRFGPEIALIADPLAITSQQKLEGGGPSTRVIAADTAGKHAILLFERATISKVLECYGAYLQEVFTKDDLRKGVFAAVGAVHKPKGDDNVPHSVGHYWSDYDHELVSAEPKPKTFLQYVAAGRAAAEQSSASNLAVERIAEGLFRLARIVNPLADLANKRRRHRHVLELLAVDDALRVEYQDLVMTVGVEGVVPSSQDWQDKWAPLVTRVAEKIAGAATEKVSKADIEDFLAYLEVPVDAAAPQRDNLFRFPRADPAVKIRVGSIHSVKGETHTATLVLETFFHKYHMQELKPWLLGDKAGGAKCGVRLLSRQKLHYVAMTRPTHLLCLALRDDTFSADEIGRLQASGWRVGFVREAGMDWIGSA